MGLHISRDGLVKYGLGKSISVRWRPWVDLNNPRGSYTGAMSYEHEPAGLIRESFTPLLLVAPASFSNTPC
jgi:hypothetical protein